MAGVDIVIHTAAIKHVNICEYNLFEAVKRTLNQQNVVDTSHRANADQIYTPDSGELTENGTQEELLKQSRAYANLYSLQAS